MSSSRLAPAIFLDRDGTIIRDRHYLKDPQHIRYYKGTFSALKILHQSGYKLVLITNQSGVGRGFMSRRDVERVHGQLKDDLKKHGVRLNAIYTCPHHPVHRCPCRKPKPTLFRRAVRELSLDTRRSYLIGDRPSDVLPAKALGARGLLVLTGQGRRHHPAISKIEFVKIVRDIAGAACWILEGGKNDSVWKTR